MVKIHSYSCDGCHVEGNPVFASGTLCGHRDERYLEAYLDNFTFRRDEICRAFELGFTPAEVIPHLMKSLKRESKISGKVAGHLKAVRASYEHDPEFNWYVNNGKKAKELIKKLREDFNEFFEALPADDYCTYTRS